MKKTMLALMATVGLAFGAKAVNSTGFESYTGDFAYDLNDSGEALAPRYWVVTNATPDLGSTVLTAYGVPPAYVPWAFTNTVNDTYLKVDTSNEVLYRSVEAVDDVNALNAGTAIGDGLYFDANVQFTASDGDVTPETGDKLVVWLKADEENNTTNLMVTAGVFNNASGEYDPIPFEIDGTYFADTWYRLTVKAMVESDVTKFVVYVDDTQVQTGGVDVVFNSLVQTGTSKATLTAVGFKGTGAVDNLVWTTEDPFYVETYEFTANVTLEGDSGNYVDTWTLNGEVKDGETSVSAVVEVGAEAEVVVRIVTSWEDVTVTATLDETPVAEANIVKTDGEGDEEGSYVYTITIDGSSYVDGDEIALAITVTENGGGSEEPTTVEPGGVAQTTTEEAAKAVVVKAPDGSGITDGETYNTYASYFTQKVTGSGSEWTTTFELNESGTNTLQEAANSALTTADTGVLAKALTLSSTTAEATAKVTITKGFYWTLATGSALGTWTYPAGTLSTGAEADLTVKKPDLGKGFYKLIVSPQPIEAKAE